MDYILEAKDINKYFYQPQEFHVLKDNTFKVKKREFLALMGKSGSGKSTLLYILSTMDRDYTGELYIQGKHMKGRSGNWLARFRNQHIGFVFQFHYLLPEFTATQNVMLPAEKLGAKTREEIEHDAINLLQRLGLEGQERKTVNRLSGGQQQRVAIARALINNPAIIMGDEPTGNLDRHNTKIVLDIFQEISEEFGQSIIAVTHDPDFSQVCNRTIELSDGVLV